MFFYINMFFIFSFLGFLFENVWMLIINENYFNSGILYGPWAFIYGIAILCLMFIGKKLREKKLKIWLEVLIFFIIAVFLMTFIEFCGGILIERLFHKVYWDYTNMKINFGRYICLEVSFFWGLFATVVSYLLVPLMKKLAVKIPRVVTVIVMVLFVVDIIATMVN